MNQTTAPTAAYTNEDIVETYGELEDLLALATKIAAQLTTLETANTDGCLDDAVAAARELAVDVNFDVRELYTSYRTMRGA